MSTFNQTLKIRNQYTYINHLTPNDRTANLQILNFLFIQQIYVLNILNILRTLCFFLFKMSFIS